MAAALGPHRPDMGLEAMLGRHRATVVADCHRKEMELDVRVGNSRARADEAAALEVVGRPETVAAHQPAHADQRFGDGAEGGIERDGLSRGDLEVELEMILQVLADPRKVVHGLDAEGPQLISRADPGELQELRIVYRASGQDDLAPRHGTSGLSAFDVLDADRPSPFEKDA